MQKILIDYSKTGYFTTLIQDYLAQKNTVLPFYKYAPTIENALTIAQNFSFPQSSRQLLVKVLDRQYSGFEISEATRYNIQSLLQPNSFSVVTGHQPCILTGPLYFLYKIITAINLSVKLNLQHPSKHFVPVYWMGSDDHDFDEINHIHLFGKTITWDQPLRTATGRLSPQTLRSVLEELRNIAGQSVIANDLMEVFEQAYLQHQTLAQSTRFLVNYLFGQDGLIVIDQDDKELKKQFVPVMKDELLAGRSFHLVQTTNEHLQEKGYPKQAFARPINLFYLTDEYRNRIEKNPDNHSFTIHQTNLSFTSEAILYELDNHPERFSPNVILRPLFQQTVLPSIAYIGGGGELAYWLQLKSVFDYNQVPFPMLWLRNSLLYLDTAVVTKMNAISLQPEQLFVDTETLISRYVEEQSLHNLNLSEQKKLVIQIYDQIKLQALKIDPTLEASVSAEATKATNGMENIEAKLLKAEKRKYDTVLQQIKNIKNKLFPNGNLQERYENFIPFYLLSNGQFISLLKKHIDPTDHKFTILLNDSNP